MKSLCNTQGIRSVLTRWHLQPQISEVDKKLKLFVIKTLICKSDNSRIIGGQKDNVKTESYYCDFCNNTVLHHKSNSKIKIGHFKHK